MGTCNTPCTDCAAELDALLSGIPSLWRSQIVTVICQYIAGKELDCSKVLECLGNEMDVLDYQCLAESDSEWRSYSFTQKLQKIIDKICDDLANNSPELDITSSTLSVTPGGTLGHAPTIELVPSTDAGNLLEIGGDGLPYVGDPGTSPDLVPTDSQSIDFTATGTLHHNITATVRLNPTNNLISVGASGLLVDSTAVSPVLTFSNGLTRSANNIKLGGTLGNDTSIVLDTNYIEFTGDSGTEQCTTTMTNNSFTTGSHDDGTDLFCLTSNKYDLWVAELKVVGLSPAAYYAEAQLAMTPEFVKMGHYFPTSNDGVTPAPADDPYKTAYLILSDGLIDTYASRFAFTAENNTQTSGAITSGRRYKVLSNGGGADFTASGASVNTVGTIFTSNGVTPTWGSGSLELLGMINLYSQEAYLQGQLLVKTQGSGATPSKNAQLELVSTTKGFIPSRMTQAQRLAITSPEKALLVYQTDGTEGVYIYDGATWRRLNWT